MAREKDTIAASDEHNSRGIELADRGWIDEAIKEFKKAIELDPNSAHAHDNLATVFAEKKQFRAALDEYLMALRLEPDSATAHYNLACFLSAHAIDFAIAEYREAIELEPDYPDAHLNLGLTLRRCRSSRRGDARAQARGRARRRRRAPSPRARQPRRWTWATTASAIAQLKEVVRLDPKSFEGWLDLGICYAQKGFYAEAERAYESAKGAQG